MRYNQETEVRTDAPGAAVVSLPGYGFSKCRRTGTNLAAEPGSVGIPGKWLEGYAIKRRYHTFGLLCLVISFMFLGLPSAEAAVTFTSDVLKYTVLTETGSTGTVAVEGAKGINGDVTIPDAITYNGRVLTSISGKS